MYCWSEYRCNYKKGAYEERDCCVDYTGQHCSNWYKIAPSTWYC